MRSFPKILHSCLAMALLLSLAGCSEKVVYNRSIADLNQKAQELISQGDINGAVARLESARDLNPDEPNTLFNLAVAYQQKGDLDKSIQAFEHLLTLKNAPSKDKINQSLAVVYEEKGDELLNPSDDSGKEPKDKKNAEIAAQRNKTEALTYYQKAKETYQSLGGDGQAQAQAVDKKIEAAQKQSAG